MATDDEVWVSAFDPKVGFRQPGVDAQVPAKSAPDSLRPSDYVLQASVAVPDGVMRGIEADPDLAYTLKADLGHALAQHADRAFLGNAGLPRGVDKAKRVKKSRQASDFKDVLEAARKVVEEARRNADEFRCPGWVLSPGTLQRLSVLQTATGVTEGEDEKKDRTLDTFALLRLDGADGGTLLGYPFVTTLAAAGAQRGDPERMYFGSDWEEACVGCDSSFVTVDAPATPAVADATVIRASMPLDFLLRRANGFAWASIA